MLSHGPTNGKAGKGSADNRDIEAGKLRPDTIGGQYRQIPLLTQRKTCAIAKGQAMRTRGRSQSTGCGRLIDIERDNLDAKFQNMDAGFGFGHAILAKLAYDFCEIHARHGG